MKENNPHILGTEKVGKLLLEYSIPAIIGGGILYTGRGGWRYHFFYPPGAEGYGRCREGAGKRNGALCDKFYFLRRHHLLFLDRILFFFGASHDTLPYARDFMQIILIEILSPCNDRTE